MKISYLRASSVVAFVTLSAFASADSGNTEAAEALFSPTSQSVVKKARNTSLRSNALTAAIASRKPSKDLQNTQQLIHVALPSTNKVAQ